MARIGLRALGVLCCSLSCFVWSLVPAHAADTAGMSFDEARSKQEKIYRSEGDQTVEGYTVNRSLSLYADGLAGGFDRALANLGPNDRWLDVGAGQAFAVLDYYTKTYDAKHPEILARNGAKARAVAMSIEDRRTPRWQETAARVGDDQIKYLADKRLREYSAQELGRFNLISDVIGGFSYSENLSVFMEKVLGFLEPNGSFYTVLQDVQWENGANKPHYEGSPFLTTIKDADGSDMKVCTWLKRISCVEVTCEAKPQWQPAMEAYRVRKVCDNVEVPALTLMNYDAGTPPERRYQVKAPARLESAKASE